MQSDPVLDVLGSLEVLLSRRVSSGNLYSPQATSGLLKCPTPPPVKNQSLTRKHSLELGQMGLLSPAALSPMASTQSEQPLPCVCGCGCVCVCVLKSGVCVLKSGVCAC